jgi:hypothetical protein
VDAYRIGVSIVLANGVSPVLAVIGRDLLHLHTSTRQIEQNFSGWGRALAGVGAILAGSTILGAMVKLTKQASEFNEQLIKMKRLGGEAGEMANDGRLTKRAFDIAQRVPMKVSDIMKIPGVTYSMMGMHEADETWEALAKYAFVLQSDKKYKGDVTGDLQKVIRAGEMSGRITDPVTKQIDPHRLEKFLSQASQIAAATHGMVGPDALLAMAQQGGPTLRGLTDEGFLTMAIQAQMMGGHRAGTAYMSLWQQLAGGTMLKRTAQGMEEMGFLKPDEWSSEGGHVSIKPEASKRLGKMIGEDPLAFARAINEDLAKKGITDPVEQMQAVLRMTGRQTTQRFTMEEVVAFQQMIAERERLKQGMGNEDAFKLLQKESVNANVKAVSNAWDNFVTALAGPNSENLIRVLQSMTNVLNQMTAAVSKLSPEQMNVIYQVVAGIAGALVAIGAVALASLLGIPALIAAVVGAFVTLVAINWETIKNGMHAFEQGVVRIASIAWDKVTGVFNTIASAISSFVDKILDIGGKVGWLFGFGSNKMPGFEENALKKKSSFVPNDFNPGARGQPKQQLALSLNIDGRTLAQSVSDELQSMYAFATGAPAPDGSGRFYNGDHNYSNA